jgi:hypothetical protein
MARPKPSSLSRRDDVFSTARVARPLALPASRFPTRPARYSNRQLVRNPLISTKPADTIVKQRRPIGVSGYSSWAAAIATDRSRFPKFAFHFPFEAPVILNRAFACARRTIRREVLFAIRGTGKGSKKLFRKRTKNSKEVC